MAEAEKQQRYPPAAGRRVTTFAVETWGRLGAEAEQVLQQLAAAARRRDQQRDRLAVNRIPKWRALIDATNQRSIARRILGAFLGSDGKPWRPPPYRRDAAHEANTHRLTACEQMTFPHTGLDPARLHQWTDNVHGGGKGNDRRGTTTTQAPAGPPQTPLTPLRTRAETSPPRRAAPFPVSNHNATAAPSQSYQHDSCRTPSQTPHGSTYPQGLHAVNAHELEQPAGPAPCNRTPYNTCLICLASPAREGPNVCTREMTDFATHTQPATQCRHLLHRGPTSSCPDPDHVHAAEPIELAMETLSDGAVSACTGSRSRSSKRSAYSGPTAHRNRGSSTDRQTAHPRRSLRAHRSRRTAGTSSPTETTGRRRARRRGRSRTNEETNEHRQGRRYLQDYTDDPGSYEDLDSAEPGSDSQREQPMLLAPAERGRNQTGTSRRGTSQLRRGKLIRSRTRENAVAAQAGPLRGRRNKCAGDPGPAPSCWMHH